MIPAAFTTVVSPPNRSSAADTMRSGAEASVTSALQNGGLSPFALDFRRDVGQRAVVPANREDRCPGPRKPQSCRPANPTRRTCHNYLLSHRWFVTQAEA